MAHTLGPILPIGLSASDNIDDYTSFFPSSLTSFNQSVVGKRKRGSITSLEAFDEGIKENFYGEAGASSIVTDVYQPTGIDPWNDQVPLDNSFIEGGFGDYNSMAEMDVPPPSMPDFLSIPKVGPAGGSSEVGREASTEAQDAIIDSTDCKPTASTDDVRETPIEDRVNPAGTPTDTTIDELFGDYKSPGPRNSPISPSSLESLPTPLCVSNAAHSNLEHLSSVDMSSNDGELSLAAPVISDVPCGSGSNPADHIDAAQTVLIPPQIGQDPIIERPSRAAFLKGSCEDFASVPSAPEEQGLLGSASCPPVPSFTSPSCQASERLHPMRAAVYPSKASLQIFHLTCIPDPSWYQIAARFGVAPPPPPTILRSESREALIEAGLRWDHGRGPLILPDIPYLPPSNDTLPSEIKVVMNRYFSGIVRPPPTPQTYILWWNAVWITKQILRRFVRPPRVATTLTSTGSSNQGFYPSISGHSHHQVPTPHIPSRHSTPVLGLFPNQPLQHSSQLGVIPTTVSLFNPGSSRASTPRAISLPSYSFADDTASSGATSPPSAEDLVGMKPGTIFIHETGKPRERPKKKARRD